MGKRQFNKEYKIAALKLIKEEKGKVLDVARLLSLSESTLYHWVQEYEKHGDNSFPGKGTAIYHQQYKQNKQKILERENQVLKEEIDLLKKYRAFFKSSKIILIVY